MALSWRKIIILDRKVKLVFFYWESASAKMRLLTNMSNNTKVGCTLFPTLDTRPPYSTPSQLTYLITHDVKVL